MSNKLVVLILMGLFTVLFAASASAQGFSSILDKLDKLEAQLKSLEQQVNETPSGQTDLSGVENRLNELEQKVANVPTSQPDLSGIETRLEALEEQVSGITPGQDMTFIEASIAELAIKVKELESGWTEASATESHAEAEDEGMLSLSNIEFSGFFDLLYLAPEDSEADKGFALNQMELDISSAFSPYVTIEGAIAYGDEAFEVGAAFADLHWMGAQGSHPVQSTMFDHSGVIIGQFDIPFGADYEHIASPDRALFSTPLAVKQTVDGWNDVGLIAYGGRDNWESQVYFVNGDQENMAYGGRMVFHAGEFVRIGGSAASIINGDDELQASLYGGDALIEYEPVELRGEYIMKQNDKNAEQVDVSGYYVEGVFDTHKWSHKNIYLVGGYSAVEHKNVELSEIEDKLTQITFGAGFNLNENASLRFEYEIEDSDHHDEVKQAFGQFVVSF